MRVALISRSSMYKVKGGDTIQVLKTAEELKKLGVETSIFCASDKIHYHEFDLLHFFNIIRPADHLRHISNAKKPYVISTIYLDYSLFDKFGRPAFQQHLFNFLGKWRSEYLKNIFRFLNGQDKLVSSSYLLGHRKAMIKILKNASLLLPNSESEFRRLEADTGIVRPYHVVPNGIDTKIFGKLPGNIEKQDKIICVAQVYGMKNQHMLIEAANELKYALEIIGQPPPNHNAYYDYCRKIAGPLVTFTGHMPQEELVERYASAKVHALPSWFETTGLSSLEAAAMGCQIVAGKGGDVKDYFHDMAWYCDPMKPESIREALQQAMQAPDWPSLREHVLKNFTWERAAEETYKAYRKVLHEE